VAPDAERLGRLGVRYVAAAFPLSGDGAFDLAGQFDGVYVYENRRWSPLPETAGAAAIVLSDGTVLFRYHPAPVYVGWAVSGVTVVALAVWFTMDRRRTACEIG
jgi:hypothetical protein